MFGGRYKTLKEKCVDEKLVEIVDKKMNLHKCEDDKFIKMYNDCANRKERRLLLKEYYKMMKNK
jgi:hypothetical protein